MLIYFILNESRTFSEGAHKKAWLFQFKTRLLQVASSCHKKLIQLVVFQAFKKKSLKAQ